MIHKLSLLHINKLLLIKFQDKNNLIGIFWNIVKCLAFCLVSIFSKILSEDLQVFQIFCIAMIIRLIILLPILGFTKNNNLAINNYIFYFIRAILNTASLVLWFYTLKITPVNEATIISYTAPLFTIILAAFILKEKLNKKYLLITIFGFIGTVIAVHTTINNFTLGIFCAFATAIIWALTNIIAKIQANNESIYSQTLYNTILMILFSLPFAIIYWQPLNLSHFLILCLIGFFFLINNISLTLSFKYGKLTIVSPFDFSRLIFSYILAYIYFDEKIDIYKIIGSLIILITSIYLIKLEAHKKES